MNFPDGETFWGGERTEVGDGVGPKRGLGWAEDRDSSKSLVSNPFPPLKLGSLT